jgi:hypothetical protein
MEAKNEDYPRKNWSSMILWNCEHPANRCLTPDYVDDHAGNELHRFNWLPEKLIGDLPMAWNVLVGEQDNPNAKIAHYTLGIPEFTHYKYCDYAQQWFNTKSRMLDGLVNIKEKELA